MAFVARAGRATHRSNLKSYPRHQDQPGFAPPDRLGVECRRGRQDGAAALPLPVPVLCRGRKTFVPAVPAQRRHFPRRPLQHRVIRAADADGGAGLLPEARRVHPHLRRRAHLQKPFRAG